MSTQGSLLGGRYRVIRHLGSGGMASVLLCEDERLGRQVAVKRLHADSPEDVEQRFAREAKLGAALNHPNLVTVFDTATDEENVLIVMEYVDGEPLSRLVRRGPLRPEEVARVVTDVGEALDHAHAQGVVHRDVKPANVLIRSDGVTKLADLGIATASDGTQITRSGTVLGTAAYMAPEQLDGRGAGPPADVYALAAIAFEALSGKRPREGRTPVEIAHRIATDGPPDLNEAWPNAPTAAARAIQRGMALEPEDRPRSGAEFARELADALGEGEPSTRTAATRPLAAPPVPSSPPRTPSSQPRTPSIQPRGHRPAAQGGSRRRLGAVALAAVFIALALATIAGAILSSGDDGGSGDGATGEAPAEQADKAKQPKKAKKPKKEKQKAAAPAPAGDPERQPAEERPVAYDPARGAQLNEDGFELMGQERYEEAIPVLEEAVASFPPNTDDLNYAYALFNLGRSLRLAGRPEDAIPILEQRLAIPNQTETVQAELDEARRQAGRE